MAALCSIGSLMQDSGWTAALAEVGITSSGTAESFLSAANVMRTRQAYQITACSLYKLMKIAYNEHCNDTVEVELISFHDWCKKRRQESPQFSIVILF